MTAKYLPAVDMIVRFNGDDIAVRYFDSKVSADVRGFIAVTVPQLQENIDNTIHWFEDIERITTPDKGGAIAIDEDAISDQQGSLNFHTKIGGMDIEMTVDYPAAVIEARPAYEVTYAEYRYFVHRMQDFLDLIARNNP